MAAFPAQDLTRARLFRRLTETAREFGVESEAEFVAVASGLRGQARDLFLSLATNERTGDELRRRLDLANVAVIADRINRRLAKSGDGRRVVCNRHGRKFVWRITWATPYAGE